MSPEQARGLGVDHRSDIFSLGAVIYEMIARRKPFEGETPSDTLAAILKTEPPSLSRLAPEVPSELVRIVTKSLRKDREERYQVVKDLWLDLKALKQELEFQDKLGASEAEPTAVMIPGEPTATLSGPRQTVSRTAISESISIELKRHKVAAAVTSIVLILIVTGAGFGVYKWLNRAVPVEHFANVKFTRLTSSGNVIHATISPDGKYIVYALSDRSSQSLYIRQVSTANDRLIVPPAPIGIFGMTFSPDGTELYYVVKANDAGTLYRIPALGGTSVKVLEGIDSPITFSPDGKQFALVRGSYPNTGESALVIANVDGSGARNLAVKQIPQTFWPATFVGPSWSPDGKIIASTVATFGGRSRVVGFAVADGSEKDLSPESWPFLGRVEWLPDMTGLLLIAGDQSNAMLLHVGYPDGRIRRITNDLSEYRGIGLTQDGKKLTLVQTQGLMNLWVVPEGDAAKAIRLPTGNVSILYSRSANNVSWVPDGRIAYVSNESGSADIWLADAEGGNRKQLTANGGMNLSPAASSDGKYVVFVSMQNDKKNVWRVNIDGRNSVRLTSGLMDSLPSVSPDSRWVVYTALDGVKPTLWKVSIDGGSPVQVTDHVAATSSVSPDGRFIAYTYPESYDPFAPPNRVAIIPFEGGATVKTFNIPDSGVVLTVVQWAADSKSIFYTVSRNNVTNIWSQSLDGGPPKQVTDFKDLLITGYAWSRDGKQLVCTRGTRLRDAILITDLK